ncbi:MAG: hypothetical protein ACXVB6_05970 [Mucilaginibacter sp.]
MAGEIKMVWIPLNDNDPLNQVSDDWFENLPQHIRNAAISLAITKNLSPLNLLLNLSIRHEISLATASLTDLADMLGLSTKK